MENTHDTTNNKHQRQVPGDRGTVAMETLKWVQMQGKPKEGWDMLGNAKTTTKNMQSALGKPIRTSPKHTLDARTT